MENGVRKRFLEDGESPLQAKLQFHERCINDLMYQFYITKRSCATVPTSLFLGNISERLTTEALETRLGLLIERKDVKWKLSCHVRSYGLWTEMDPARAHENPALPAVPRLITPSCFAFQSFLGP